MTTHSKYSPSSASRWSTCTASIPLIEQFAPPRRSSESARRGTFLHSVRALCLVNRQDPSEYVGWRDSVEGQEFVFQQDDADAMRRGVESLLMIPDGELLVEQKVDFGFGFGTVDAAAISDDGRHILVDDFKSGSGHEVMPTFNHQLMLYAAGLIRGNPHVSTIGYVTLRIDQPYNGGIKVWQTTIPRVMEFYQSMKEIVEKIEAGDVAYASSDDNCRWCPVLAHCPEMSKRNLQLFGFKGKEPKLPKKMTVRQRSKILKYREQIESWLQTLHDEAMADAMAGKKVPGFKVVEGRVGHRKWADEVAAEIELQRLLGDKAYVTKLISPAQAGKLLGKRLGNETSFPPTIQPPGKPILVDESDPRSSMVLFTGFDGE